MKKTLDICEWLHETYGLTTTDARSKDNYAIRYAASYGHLDVCKWFHGTYGLALSLRL